jgi:FkbM family methyltransferase
MNIAKSIAARLPNRVQVALKKAHYGRQIRRGTFETPEPEFQALEKYVRPGDWVIDIGANIGHYTLRMSRLVGPAGRVLAFEPMLQTFELLSSNVFAGRLHNVTLFNIALSSSAALGSMQVPKFDESGLDNLYQARLVQGGEFSVLCLPLDALPLPARIRLVKIDAEGHDLEVLKGMRAMLVRDWPVLIVEAAANGPVQAWLEGLGFKIHKTDGSPNITAVPPAASQ